MNREQVREAVERGRITEALAIAKLCLDDLDIEPCACGYRDEVCELCKKNITRIQDAIMALAEQPWLPSIKEIENAINPDHGTHPDRKETVPSWYIPFAAGCVHEMLTEHATKACEGKLKMSNPKA